MEHFLALEAEAKYLLAVDRSYERSLHKELLKILADAEYWFGPRIRAYDVSEPVITECFTAFVLVRPFWFARIFLSPISKTDRFFASYELAHEAIHVLAPAVDVGATVLEEGLATYFSFKYMNRVYGSYMNRVYGIGLQSSADPHYDAAMHAVSKLLAKNEFVIKELRTHQPVISKIDEKLLVEVAGIDRSQAKFLSTDFQSYARTPSPWTNRAVQGAEVFVDGFRSIWDKWRSV